MNNYICLLKGNYAEGTVLQVSNYTVYNDLLELCLGEGSHIQELVLYEIKSLSDKYSCNFGIVTKKIEIIKKLDKIKIEDLTRSFFKNHYAMGWLLSNFKYDEIFLEEYLEFSFKDGSSRKIDYNSEGDFERSLIDISKEQILSENFIKKYPDTLHLYYIYVCQKGISADFKEQFVLSNMNWDFVPLHELSDDFIIKFKKNIDLKSLCRYHNLSEKVVEQCKSEFTYKHWEYISSNTNISESVLSNNKDKIYWDLVSKRKNLSEFFKSVFKDKLQ